MKKLNSEAQENCFPKKQLIPVSLSPRAHSFLFLFLLVASYESQLKNALAVPPELEDLYSIAENSSARLPRIATEFPTLAASQLIRELNQIIPELPAEAIGKNETSRIAALLYYKKLCDQLETQFEVYETQLEDYKAHILRFLKISENNLSAINPSLLLDNPEAIQRIRRLSAKRKEIIAQLATHHNLFQKKVTTLANLRRQIFRNHLASDFETKEPSENEKQGSKLTHYLSASRDKSVQLMDFLNSLHSQIERPLRQEHESSHQLNQAIETIKTFRPLQQLTFESGKALTERILAINLNAVVSGEFIRPLSSAKQIVEGTITHLTQAQVDLKDVQSRVLRLKELSENLKTDPDTLQDLIDSLQSLAQAFVNTPLKAELDRIEKELRDPHTRTQGTNKLEIVYTGLHRYFSAYERPLSQEIQKKKDLTLKYEERQKENSPQWPLEGLFNSVKSLFSKPIPEENVYLTSNSVKSYNRQFAKDSTPTVINNLIRDEKMRAEAGSIARKAPHTLKQFSQALTNLAQGADTQGNDIFSKHTQKAVAERLVLNSTPDSLIQKLTKMDEAASLAHPNSLPRLQNTFIDLAQKKEISEERIAHYDKLIQKMNAEVLSLTQAAQYPHLQRETAVPLEKMTQLKHQAEIERTIETRRKELNDLQTNLFEFVTIKRSNHPTLSRSDLKKLENLKKKYIALHNTLNQDKTRALSTLKLNSEESLAAQTQFQRFSERLLAQSAMLADFTTAQERLTQRIDQINFNTVASAKELNALQPLTAKTTLLDKQVRNQKRYERIKQMGAAVAAGAIGSLVGPPEAIMLGVGAGVAVKFYQVATYQFTRAIGKNDNAKTRDSLNALKKRELAIRKSMNDHTLETASLITSVNKHIQFEQRDQSDPALAEILQLGSPTDPTQYAAKKKVWRDSLASLGPKQSWLSKLVGGVFGRKQSHDLDEKQLLAHQIKIKADFTKKQDETVADFKARVAQLVDAKKEEQKLWLQLLSLEHVKQKGIADKLEELKESKTTFEKDQEDYKFILEGLKSAHSVEQLMSPFYNLNQGVASENDQKRTDEMKGLLAKMEETIDKEWIDHALTPVQKFQKLKEVFIKAMQLGLIDISKRLKNLPSLIQTAEKQLRMQNQEIAELSQAGVLLSREYGIAFEHEKKVNPKPLCRNDGLEQQNFDLGILRGLAQLNNWVSGRRASQ